MIDELLSAYRLKDEPRAGWALRDVEQPESVADHSWGTALLCLLHAEEAGVDAEHCLRIALVHDIAEAEVGDVPRRVSEADQPMSRAEKARREQRAMARLADGPLAETVELWREYEEADSAEAVFVRDMNLVDMCLQALFYEHAGRRRAGARDTTGGPGVTRARGVAPQWDALDEFFATAEPRLRTTVGRRLYDEIHARYRALRRQA
jgi:putative hydrolase of HD superfamily